MARTLLGQNVMLTAVSPSSSSPTTLLLSIEDRMQVLRFAASFLWADCEVADSERLFLTQLACELDVADAPRTVKRLLDRPPVPEDVDPTEVPPGVADVVRSVALRAIAADGRVDAAEMRMFELLDDLLPRASAAVEGA